MKLHIVGAAIVLTGVLSACSSSGGYGGGQSQFDEVLSFIDRRGPEDENIQGVAVEDLPDTAEMSGVLAAQIDTSPSMFIGDANATADFAGGTLTGQANNFTEYEVTDACDVGTDGCSGTALQSLDGALDITGSISGTSFTYTTSGTLMGEDPELGSVSADIDMDGVGDFGTIDGNLVAFGTSEGTADLSSSEGSETTGAFGILLLEE